MGCSCYCRRGGGFGRLMRTSRPRCSLTRGVRVIPVLVDSARMPRREQLPASLGKLATRPAVELSPARFRADLGPLISVPGGCAGVHDRAAHRRGRPPAGCRAGLGRGVGADAAAAAVERAGTVRVLPRSRRRDREPGAAGPADRRERQRPGQAVPLVRVPRTLPRILEPGEVDALTAALRTHRDRAMAAAMVLGGLRRCEVLGLRLGDLRLAERRVLVTEGKGGHQWLIPVSARFFTEVSAYLDAERPADPGTDRVFVVLKGQRRGRPLLAAGPSPDQHPSLGQVGEEPLLGARPRYRRADLLPQRHPRRFFPRRHVPPRPGSPAAPRSDPPGAVPRSSNCRSACWQASRTRKKSATLWAGSGPGGPGWRPGGCDPGRAGPPPTGRPGHPRLAPARSGPVQPGPVQPGPVRSMTVACAHSASDSSRSSGAVRIEQCHTGLA